MLVRQLLRCNGPVTQARLACSSSGFHRQTSSLQQQQQQQQQPQYQQQQRQQLHVCTVPTYQHHLFNQTQQRTSNLNNNNINNTQQQTTRAQFHTQTTSLAIIDLISSTINKVTGKDTDKQQKDDLQTQQQQQQGDQQQGEEEPTQVNDEQRDEQLKRFGAKRKFGVSIKVTPEETQALKKGHRGSPTKFRLVIDMIRDCNVVDAEEILRNHPKQRYAQPVLAMLTEAADVAQARLEVDRSRLFVSHCTANKGQFYKRLNYHSKGRSGLREIPHTHLILNVRALPPGSFGRNIISPKTRVMNEAWETWLGNNYQNFDVFNKQPEDENVIDVESKP